jgi:hypothetical protein
VSALGDALTARERHNRVVHYTLDGKREVKRGRRKRLRTRMYEYRQAGRSYRSLSVALRNQGLVRGATRFHYLGEVMNRKALFFEAWTKLRPRTLLQALFYFVGWALSGALDLFAGYGVYRVWRLAITYLGIIGVFATLDYFLGAPTHPTISPMNAVVLSVTSFHGRGLAPSADLPDAVRAASAGEAVLGLLVEGLFIAAFTRRVTGN